MSDQRSPRPTEPLTQLYCSKLSAPLMFRPLLLPRKLIRPVRWPLMYKKLSTITLPLILLAMLGCATRPVAVTVCPAQPVPKPELRVPTPDPQLFPKCLQELLAQTSDQVSTPSCKQLQDWLSLSKSASEKISQ